MVNLAMELLPMIQETGALMAFVLQEGNSS